MDTWLRGQFPVLLGTLSGLALAGLYRNSVHHLCGTAGLFSQGLHHPSCYPVGSDFSTSGHCAVLTPTCAGSDASLWFDLHFPDGILPYTCWLLAHLWKTVSSDLLPTLKLGYLGRVFGLAVKIQIKIPTSHIRGPGFDTQPQQLTLASCWHSSWEQQ